MMNNKLKLAALVVGGYLLFCCFGVLPKYMSLVKFPSFMQQYNSPYTYVGYTYKDKLEADIDKPVVKKGAFDALGLFENGNLKNGGYFDGKRNMFYLNLKEDAVKFKGKKNLSKIAEHSKAGDGVLIKSGKYYYSIQDYGIKILMTKKDAFMVNTDSFEYEMVDYSEIASILKKQRKEKITINEFALLLRLTEEEILTFYHKESPIVLFRETDESGRYVIVSYNMDDGTVQKTEPRMKYEYEFWVNQNVLLFYDEESRSIKMFFVDTGSEMDIVVNVDSVEFMNFIMHDDGTLMYCYVTEDNRIYWRYPTKNVTSEFDYIDLNLTNGQALLVGEDKTLIYNNETENEISYSYMKNPKYTVEKQ